MDIEGGGHFFYTKSKGTTGKIIFPSPSTIKQYSMCVFEYNVRPPSVIEERVKKLIFVLKIF